LAAGPIDDGRLAGDLVVVGDDDPFFVYESAFQVLRRLRALGLREVDGRVVVRGAFLFNWQPDADGRRLAAAPAGTDRRRAWQADDAHASLAAVALRITRAHEPDAAERPLLAYRSPVLLHVVKALDGYSNNVFHYASDAIGGPHAVQATARAVVPE